MFYPIVLRKSSRFLITTLISMALIGCISPTPYQDAKTSFPKWGYADKKIEDGIYRVTFIGNPQTPLVDAYVYTLYRSAEIAQTNKASYFEVLQGFVDKNVLGKTDSSSQTPYDVRDFTATPIPMAEATHFTYHSLVEEDIPLTENHSPFLLKTSSSGGVVMVPMYGGPVAQPVVISLLIRLLQVEPVDNSRVFATNDVLTKLSSRIKKPQ
jgi:hypothetical protein